jgi:hypothetical protein
VQCRGDTAHSQDHCSSMQDMTLRVCGKCGEAVSSTPSHDSHYHTLKAATNLFPHLKHTAPPPHLLGLPGRGR